jgi:hypothetical protein
MKLLPIERQPKLIEDQIKNCQSLEDLNKVLETIKSLKNEQGSEYSAKEIMANIKILAELVLALKNNKTPLTRDQVVVICRTITRTANLRDKVIELLSPRSQE